MARLRDARTSEIVFEGTPLECVLVAQQLGDAEVAPQLDRGTEEWETDVELTFDDVGLGFDPAAVLKAARDHVPALERAVADAEDPDDRKSLQQAAAEAKAALKVDTKKVDAAKRALDAARKAQDEALRAGG